jgi:hypothetical protein
MAESWTLDKPNWQDKKIVQSRNWTLDKPNWQDKKIVQSRKMRM